MKFLFVWEQYKMLERGVRKAAVKKFVERWQQETGDEDSQARSFWIELLQDVLGFKSPTKMLDFEKKVQKRRIDVYCEEYGVLIEQKSRGIDLFEKRDNGQYGKETAYEQACWYRGKMLKIPRWIITCDFDSFYIYDVHSGDSIPYEKDYVAKLTLKDLPEKYDVFDQVFDPNTTRLAIETNISVQTTELIRKMYNALMKQYKNIETDKKEQHDLNVLIVRLVFLYYAENAHILTNTHAFRDYLKSFKPSSYRDALNNLFRVLNTSKEERDPYDSDSLKSFPYVNGGLFAEEITIPQFTEELAKLLITASENTNWKEISPTIFGALFESTLNPETRRSGGMHYTSIENIHKVIDPLFLDDLKKELSDIEAIEIQKDRIRKLKTFREKLSKLTFLDPACGSGNFLTETYLCLRKLENQILRDFILEEEEDDSVYIDKEWVNDYAWFGIFVNLNQFYGIEINDFAVAVAKTALWIAEAQAKAETEELLDENLHILPLTNNENIVVANALRMDWNQLIPKNKLNYIIGNPPFVGYKQRNDTQREDMEIVFPKSWKKRGMLDYVACWFKVASDIMKGTSIKTALVATNSITQGDLVKTLWEPLFATGMQINFAHKNFKWDSDAKDVAQVYCVIIGFGDKDYSKKKQRVLYDNDVPLVCENITGYLVEGKTFFLEDQSLPISNDAPKMMIGRIPLSGGREKQYLILEKEERDFILNKEPDASQWIRLYSNGREFIDGKDRYCLWLEGITPTQLKGLPLIYDRVKKCREWRSSKKVGSDAWKLKDIPHLFRPSKEFSPDVPYLAFPQTSTGSRDYIPIAFVTNGMIPGPKLCIIHNASLYAFGILMSSAHMIWARAFSGYLGTGISYSISILYNTFPWPKPTEAQREKIVKAAQAILDARALYSDSCLAALYDKGSMPDELKNAHIQNDKAVLEAYKMPFGISKEECLKTLKKLYEKYKQK